MSPTKIDSNTAIDVCTSTIIVGCVRKEVWNEPLPCDENGFSTLQIVQDVIHAPLITVIDEMGLEGTIYTYNNYGDGCWYITGKTCGYA